MEGVEFSQLNLPKRLCLETLFNPRGILSLLVLCEAVGTAHCSGDVTFN